MIRVGVVGAAGRMGREVCRAVLDAADLDLVAAVTPSAAGQRVGDLLGGPCDLAVAADLDALTRARADVAIDFTLPGAVAANVAWCLEHGVHAVVGTTGWDDEDLDRFHELAERHRTNAVLAPNFALGAVLMVHVAELVARHLPDAEIVELHHAAKRDAPSGTALRTADAIARARGPRSRSPDEAGARGVDRAGVRIHSVRLPGLVAHQEVVFGGQGETLTIRHDSLDRSSFMPGVLLAVRRVASEPGVTVGLESLLGLGVREPQPPAAAPER